MKEIYLNRIRSQDLSEYIGKGTLDKVIVPFGSCEAHGNHLPLGTDIFIPTEMAERVAQACPGTVIAPPVPFGTSINYDQYPLSISLSYDTTIKLTEDILRSLLNHGLKKIIILNGHDANVPALEIASRNIKKVHPEACIIVIPGWWYYSRTVLKESYQTWDGKGHAGEAETSLMLAIQPELVDMRQACIQIPHDVHALSQHGTMVIWDISEVSRTGATGDSLSATAEKGKKLMEEFISYLIQTIQKLDKDQWKYDYKK